MAKLDFLAAERRQVIYNIESAAMAKNSFMKVEVSDPCITDADIKRVILPFDNKRKSAIAKAKLHAALFIADRLTDAVNKNTSIVGLENALSVNGGAIITGNHYAPTDSTPIRIMAKLCKKRNNLHIIVEEGNIFMKGLFGFLLRNANTHPVSGNFEYTVKNLKPCIEEILEGGGFLLVYPEEQMWRNYKKPRGLRDGAYFWAARYGVPIIPTFTEMQTCEGERDADGFLPIKHTLHIGAPIYPDSSLSLHENRDMMMKKDAEFKKSTYERVYGIALDENFIIERDIAGI